MSPACTCLHIRSFHEFHVPYTSQAQLISVSPTWNEQVVGVTSIGLWCTGAYFGPGCCLATRRESKATRLSDHGHRTPSSENSDLEQCATVKHTLQGNMYEYCLDWCLGVCRPTLKKVPNHSVQNLRIHIGWICRASRITMSLWWLSPNIQKSSVFGKIPQQTWQSHVSWRKGCGIMLNRISSWSR